MLKAYRVMVKKSQPLIDLISQFTNSRKSAKKLIDEGLCSVGGVKERFYRKRVNVGCTVKFTVTELLFKKPKIEILYEDEYLLVVNKPPFINSNKNAPNVESILRKRYKNVYLVHRLDKQTTGALIVAKSRKVFELFVEEFKKKKVRKSYLVLTAGNLMNRSGKIAIPLDGKEAISIYKIAHRIGKTELLNVNIPTGRKHQIRRHFASLDHPVVGESIYWKGRYPEEFHLFAPRTMLHAEKLSFEHPIKGDRIEVKAPLFEDFKTYIEILEGKKSLHVLML